MADKNIEKAFSEYFFNNKIEEKDITGIISEKPEPKDNIRYKPEERLYKETISRLTADGNIDTIEQICNVLKELLNAAWGTDWGEISPDLKKGEHKNSLKLPQITVEINTREIPSGFPVKPVLIDIFKEKVNGELTGDSFLIYRQWFGCILEFNFYAESSREVRKLQDDFESLLMVYTGYLKRKGISELIFSEEKSAKNSLNYTEQVPMKCLTYFARLERITPVRQSLLTKINTEIGITLTNEKIYDTIEKNKDIKSDIEEPAELDFEFDFFNQDTGVEIVDDI